MTIKEQSEETASRNDLEKVLKSTINEMHKLNVPDAEIVHNIKRIIRKRKEAGSGLDNAIAYAIDYCIENGILAEFLQKNRDEVMVMLCAEYSFEDFKADTEMLIQKQAEQLADKEEQLADREEQLAEQKEYITDLEKENARLKELLEKANNQ